MEDNERALAGISDILPSELDALPQPYLWVEHAAWGKDWEEVMQRWRGEISKTLETQKPDWFVWHEKPEVWISVDPNIHTKEEPFGPTTGWSIRSCMVVPASASPRDVRGEVPEYHRKAVAKIARGKWDITFRARVFKE